MDIPFSIQQTSDGGYIVTGYTSVRILVLKLDSTGDIGGYGGSCGSGFFISDSLLLDA